MKNFISRKFGTIRYIYWPLESLLFNHGMTQITVKGGKTRLMNAV